MKNIFNQKYPITKMHGTGNDFVIYVDFDEKTSPADVVKICDRHFGVGADGVLTVVKSDIKEVEYRMKYFNSDGSAAEMCGNGIRCFAKYLIDNGLASQKNKIFIDTAAGIITTRVLSNSNEKAMIKVNMGRPVFVNQKQATPKTGKNGIVRMDISVTDSKSGKNEKLRGLYIGMGNPHAIFFVKKGQAEKFAKKFGSQIENNTKIFPQKTNVEFVEVIGDKELNINVWERGAGLTLSCGTGTCASLIAATIEGFIKNHAKVNVPGGVLDVSWDGMGSDVFMTGPAVSVFNINNLNL